MTKDPTIGVGIAYYGGMHPRHAQSQKALLKAGIPVLQIHGCAYPEMARAEVVREALEAGVDVLVIADHNTEFTPSAVRELAHTALNRDAIVSASFGYPVAILSSRISVEGVSWQPNECADCAFCAIPLSVIQRMAESETREYTNSAVISTVMSESSRPFFSPWQKAPGTLQAPPIEPRVYCSPDRAFLLRAQALGIPIYCYQGLEGFRMLGSGGYTLNIRGEGGKESRLERLKRHGLSLDADYAICVPSFGTLDLEQQEALWECEKAGACIIELNGCPYLDLARAELCRIAIDELGMRGMFFLDHDIIFKPGDVFALCEEAEKRQDVVAAVYCMRKTAHALIGAPDLEVDEALTFFEGGGVVPALYSGMGFTAIPRAVIESLKPSFPTVRGFLGNVHPLWALDVNGNFYAGEDTSFCARVQGLSIKHIPGEPGEATPNAVDWELKRTKSPTGHRVWLDTRVRIFHKGAYHYGIEDHSIAVPRYESLEGHLKATRAEARKFLRSAGDLPVETRLRAIGLDEKAESPHSGLIDEEVRA